MTGASALADEGAATSGPSVSRKLAALINPRSFRMHIHQRARRTSDRVRAHGGMVFEVDSLETIERALASALQRGANCIVIAGGDGTLQGVSTWLATHVAGHRMPELIVLSAGRTNYVASDLGTRRHFVDTLELILSSAPEGLHPIRRRSLALSHPSIGTQHGFFMAGASVDQAIRDIHRSNQQAAKNRLAQYAASTTGLIALLARWAVGRFQFELPRLGIETDCLGDTQQRCRFLLLTSLPLHAHWVKPYAGRGRGEIRITAIADRAKGLAWRLPAVLRGRFGAGMDTRNGYFSGRCKDLQIHNLSSITLDGQELDLDPSEPLCVSQGPEFRFLRP